MISRSRLYTFILGACAAGYTWIAIASLIPANAPVGVCLFKHTTHIPCPSCGSTRSVLSLLHGDWLASVLINPLGVLITIFLLAAPLWILSDIFRKRDTFYRFYTFTEIYLRKIWVAIPLITLVLLNWIWNIHKGL